MLEWMIAWLYLAGMVAVWCIDSESLSKIDIVSILILILWPAMIPLLVIYGLLDEAIKRSR